MHRSQNTRPETPDTQVSLKGGLKQVAEDEGGLVTVLETCCLPKCRKCGLKEPRPQQ